jgi:pimeloyl-ACP methyl ester carboxylesterase
MIYFPPVLTATASEDLGRARNMERWVAPDGTPLGWKRASPVQPATGRLLITYGNGGCALYCDHYANVIQQAAALDVFIVDYPGYADRPGKPTEKSLEASADEAFRVLEDQGPVYVVGESLGTGVAAYLAGKHPDKVAGVVLLAPYNRLVDVAQYHMPILPVGLMLCDRFPSQDYLRAYHGPVAMLVGGRDRVVPEKFGRRLYAAYAGPKRLWEFPEGNHGTVMVQPPELWKQVVEFWRTNR